MRKFILIFVLVALLSACNSKPGEVKAVEDYLIALVSKDSAKLSTGVCADFEEQALLELDSFQAVDTKLDNMACSQAGTDGTTALVRCTGNIIATYDAEDQAIDLSTRTYQVIQENGNWLVCGVR